MAAYQSALAGAQGVPNQFNPYGGEFVAPVNQQQNLGIGGINQYAQSAQPYLQQAAGLATSGATPLTPADIQNYYNPYQQDVIAATQGLFNQQNAQQQSNLLGNAASQHALGGDRVGVAQANLAGQQQLTQAPVLAGLESQGFSQAAALAMQQKQLQQAGAYGLGNIAQGIQGAGLSGATAQIGAGSLQQQTQQQLDQALLAQFMQQQAYPYARAQFEAGIAGGIGSQMGGTGYSTTTAPPPNPFAQYAGLGIAGLGLFAKDGGRVAGFADGGVPPLTGGGLYGGVQGYIPQVQMQLGNTMPKMSAPQSPQQQAFDPIKFAKSAMAGYEGASSLGDKLGVGGEYNPLTAYGPNGEIVSASDYEEGAAHGGRIPGFDDGGAADTFADRFDALGPAGIPSDIVFNPTPMSTGVGAGNLIRDEGVSAQPPPITSPSGVPYASAAPTTSARGSWYSQAPGWRDYADRPNSNALGVADSQQGIALPSRNTLGQWFDVRAPNGQTYRLQQTDVGPARWTGRGIDISAAAASKMGYTPQDFPTDAKFSYASASGPGESDGVAAINKAVGANDGMPSSASGFAPRDEELNARPPPAATRSGIGLANAFGLSDNAKMGLMAAGLGMMASKSPFLGTAIGEGGLKGVQAYAEQKEQGLSREDKRKALDLQVKRLQQASDQFTAKQKQEESQFTKGQELEREKMEQGNWQPWVDNYGRQIGFYNRKTMETKTMEDIASGKTTAPPGVVKPPAAPSTPAPTPPPAPAPAPAPAPVEGTPTATLVSDTGLPASGVFPTEPRKDVHPEALNDLTPGQRKRVIAMAEGREKLPPVGRAKSENNLLREKVYEYDDKADETKFGRRDKTAKFFAVGTNQGGGQAINNMNTFAHHIAGYLQLAEKYNLGDYTNWNAFKNALVARGFSDKESQDILGAIQIKQKTVADEGAKIYAGQSSALGDRQEWLHRLGLEQPLHVTRAQAKALVEQVEGRLVGLAHQYNEGMETNFAPQKFIAPDTRKIFASIKAGKTPEGTHTEETAVGQIESDDKGVQYRFKGGNRKDKNNWERLGESI